MQLKRRLITPVATQLQWSKCDRPGEGRADITNNSSFLSPFYPPPDDYTAQTTDTRAGVPAIHYMHVTDIA